MIPGLKIFQEKIPEKLPTVQPSLSAHGPIPKENMFQTIFQFFLNQRQFLRLTAKAQTSGLLSITHKHKQFFTQDVY